MEFRSSVFKPLLSPRDLASAIGVSESSLKRWVDDGLIRATRTAGGHRRIAVTEAIRFIRASKTPLLRPDLLGMYDLERFRASDAEGGATAKRLFDYLRSGRAPEARGLVLGSYLAGEPVAAICDGPIQHAMEQLGELWQHDQAGVFYEHRATDICIQALQQLRLALPDPPDSPVRAIGGAPPGDPYLLPPMAAATVLASEGIPAVNLGPDTPFETFLHAAQEHQPQFVWLSISIVPDERHFVRGFETLAGQLGPLGISIIVGGRARAAVPVSAAATVYVGASMAELVAFAKGMSVGSGAGPDSAERS
jgi:excisionase family DNA binding protein